MSARSWGTTSGLWSIAGDWTLTRTAGGSSPARVPDSATEAALITRAGSYTVTVDTNRTYLLDRLVLGAADAELDVQGTLRFHGTNDIISLDAGTLSLTGAYAGGIVRGATIQANGGVLAASGGTLDAVTYDGTLDLSANNSTLYVANSLTATGLNGTGPGVVDLTGNADAIYFEATQTFDNATVTLGTASGGDDSLYEYDNTGLGNQILTLGSHLIINADGYVNLGIDVQPDPATGILDYVGDGIINRGTINAGNADTVNGEFILGGLKFTNQGLINVAGPGAVFLDQALNFINQGTIAVTGGAAFDDYDNFSNTAGGRLSVSGTGSTIYLGYGQGWTWANAGSIIVRAGGQLSLGGVFTMAGLGSVTDNGGSIGIYGTLINTGETLAIGHGTRLPKLVLDGAIVGGTIVDRGQGVAILGGTLSGVTYEGTLALSANTAALTITNGLTATAPGHTGPGTINLTGSGDSLSFAGTETFDNATVTMSGSIDHLYITGGDNQTLTLGKDLTINADSTNYETIEAPAYSTGEGILNQGIINADGAKGVLYAETPIFTNAGTINIDNGGSFSDSSWNFDNKGTINATGGKDFYAYNTFENEGLIKVFNSYAGFQGTTSLTSTGTILLGNDGTLEIGPATAADITYSDPATLILDNPGGYTGTLLGLAPGDALQLDGKSISSASIADSVLTARLAGGGKLTYATGPGPDGMRFSVSQGSDGHLDLLTALCFLAGTRILTDRGEVPIGDLHAGDMVVTRGANGATAPVRWIGRRRIEAASHPQPATIRPIRIRRDAVGPGQPHRDLLVSPDHAVYLDDVLIPAKLLVNGMTIVQDTSLSRIDYLHVELDRHAILISEGLETESYLDTGNRAMFENAGLPPVLHPDFATVRDRNEHSCAPLAVAATTVEPVWRRLAARAEAIGFSPPAPVQTTTDPDLQLAIGARVIRPVIAGHEGRYTFVIPPGATAALLTSRTMSPADIEPFRDDRRRLGVAVRHLRLHGTDGPRHISIDDPALSKGWWAAEQASGALWRWTDGKANITLPPGTTMLDVDLHSTNHYPVDGTFRLQAA